MVRQAASRACTRSKRNASWAGRTHSSCHPGRMSFESSVMSSKVRGSPSNARAATRRARARSLSASSSSSSPTASTHPRGRCHSARRRLARPISSTTSGQRSADTTPRATGCPRKRQVSEDPPSRERQPHHRVYPEAADDPDHASCIDHIVGFPNRVRSAAGVRSCGASRLITRRHHRPARPNKCGLRVAGGQPHLRDLEQ